MDDIALKLQFAALFLRDKDPFKAALTLLPDDTRRALQIAQAWPTDKDVIKECERISEFEPESVLMTRLQYLQKLEDRMNNAVKDADFAKIANTYGTARGFFDMSDKTSSQTITAPVAYIPVLATEDEWAKAALKQQTQSLENARSRH